MKMYAIVDTGDMFGDSQFYCPESSVEYKKGMTLEDVKTAYATKLQTGEYSECEEDALEAASEIGVAWIVDEKTMTALNKAANSVEFYNDNGVYAGNRMMKAMAEALAMETLK